MGSKPYEFNLKYQVIVLLKERFRKNILFHEKNESFTCRFLLFINTVFIRVFPWNYVYLKLHLTPAKFLYLLFENQPNLGF